MAETKEKKSWLKILAVTISLTSVAVFTYGQWKKRAISDPAFGGATTGLTAEMEPTEKPNIDHTFPKKLVQTMLDNKGQFSLENLVYDQVTKIGDEVSCHTEGLHGGLLGIGAVYFFADLNYNVRTCKGVWSVKFRNGAKLPQGGGVIVIPAEMSGVYNVTFKNEQGKFQGKGTLQASL